MPSWMNDMYETVRADAYLGAAVILVLSVLASALVNVIVVRIVLRLAKKTRTELDDKIVAALRFPLFISVVLIGGSLALRHLGLGETALFVTDGVLVSLGVIFWGVGVFRSGHAVLDTLAAVMDRYRFIQPRTLPLMDILLKIAVVGGAAYGVLLAWDVDVTAWLASAGILGIAVGFAAKDTLANFFSGIFILADAPYKLGDFILLDSGERGVVTDIGVRSTRLLTRNDIEIIVPNAAIANAKILNETGGPHEKERITVAVGVAYGSDIDLVREVLYDEAQKSKNMEQDPSPRVRFLRFGDSSLDFELRGWVETPALRTRALDELNTAVYKRFAAEGIEIPFPQRDVHLIQQ